MARLWVARLEISYPVAQKLIHKHHIDPQHVQDAVRCVSGLTGAYDDHPDWGVRFILEVEVNREKCLVALYPTDDNDVYRLGTCHRC